VSPTTRVTIELPEILRRKLVGVNIFKFKTFFKRIQRMENVSKNILTIGLGSRKPVFWRLSLTSSPQAMSSLAFKRASRVKKVLFGRMCLCRPISLRLTQRFLIRMQQQQQKTSRMHAAQITVTTKETNATQPPKNSKRKRLNFTNFSLQKFSWKNG